MIANTGKLFFLITLFFQHGLLAEERPYFLEVPGVQKYAVIITGAAASKLHQQQFQEWSFALYDTLLNDYAYPQNQVLLLLGKGDSEDPRIFGSSRQADIQKVMATLQTKVKPGDQIAFILMGHGSSDQEAAKFNIVGPDITGKAFSEFLDSFVPQNLIVVNTTSTSYPFSVSLSAPGRVIISATRSHVERYDTVFAKFWIEALTAHQGDRDKNKRVSLWEAFQYTQEKVKAHYEGRDRLPTEHPTLDDNGDSLFSVTPDPTQNDGSLSQVAYLNQVPIPLKTSAEATKLLAKKAELERSIILLRNRKTSMTPGDYTKSIRALLLELALTSRKLKN